MKKISTVASAAALAVASLSASAWWAAPYGPYGMTEEQQKAIQARQQAMIEQQTKHMAQMMAAHRQMAEQAQEQDWDPTGMGFPAPEFPAMPEMPAPYGMNAPEFPAMPEMPEFGQMPAMPEMPAPYGMNAPEFPAMPEMPGFGQMPAMPEMPAPYAIGARELPVPPKMKARYEAMKAQRAKMMEESQARRAKAMKELEERRQAALAQRSTRFARPAVPFGPLAKAPEAAPVTKEAAPAPAPEAVPAPAAKAAPEAVPAPEPAAAPAPEAIPAPVADAAAAQN